MSENRPSPSYLSVDQALDHASSRPVLDGYWKVILNCFFVFYFFVLGVWFMDDSELKQAVSQHTRRAMEAFGWYQHWSLFSPHVRHIIYHETAIITFKDGSTKIYEYPRMEKMSIIEKFRREKLRKMFGDNMPWPGYKQFLPVFAKHLAKANYTPDNPPLRITYVFNMNENPNVLESGIIPRDKPLKHVHKSITFTYQIRDKDDLNSSSKFAKTGGLNP